MKSGAFCQGCQVSRKPGQVDEMTCPGFLFLQWGCVVAGLSGWAFHRVVCAKR